MSSSNSSNSDGILVTDRGYFPPGLIFRPKKYPLPIVIPSKGRHDIIAKGTLRMFPDALVYVEESEVDAYAKVTQNIMTHPMFNTYGKTLNWLLDNLDAPDFMMFDDDLVDIVSMTGRGLRHYKDTETCLAIIEQTYSNLLGLESFGAKYGGWTNSIDPRTFRGTDPFSFSGFIPSGSAIYRGRNCRFDPRLSLRLDIDYCLEQLRVNRIVFLDRRYSMSPYGMGAFNGKGGQAEVRSFERDEAERQLLQKKWGDYIQFLTRSSKDGSNQASKSVIQVPRKVYAVAAST